MSYSHLVTSNYVSVMNMMTGKVTKFMHDNPYFQEAYTLICQKRYDEVEQLSMVTKISNSLNESKDVSKKVSVVIEDGCVKYQHDGGEFKILNNIMTDKIVSIIGQGFSAEPFILFLENLLQNPSKTAIDELYLFMEATNLPITDDGYFIAYKIVNDDYTSIHDKKTPNNVGTYLEMPRQEVDDNRNNTCSSGFHFCGREYLQSYGSKRRNNDRLLLLKINPADVVSIPSDYKNQKGRACKYLIYKDISDSSGDTDWRTTFKDYDYTNLSVEITITMDSECPECGSTNIIKNGFSNNGLHQRFKCKDCNRHFTEGAY